MQSKTSIVENGTMYTKRIVRYLSGDFDMDIEWKRAVRYRNMARKGVTCTTLRQDFTGGPNTWTLECWKNSELSNDHAKDAVSDYLKDEFEATHISFFTKRNGGANRFFARFVSYAL
jgi:hypothetical protein